MAERHVIALYKYFGEKEREGKVNISTAACYLNYRPVLAQEPNGINYS